MGGVGWRELCSLSKFCHDDGWVFYELRLLDNGVS